MKKRIYNSGLCKKHIVLGIIFLFLGAGIVQGISISNIPSESGTKGILVVPDEYPTIQAAINAANDEDIILVRNGTYTGEGNRDLDFQGKAIVLKSMFGPDVTIIDCEGTMGEPHRGFQFHTSETIKSVVEGFTITNGWGDNGGGILIDQSSPTITNCILSENSAGDYGGGIYIYERAAPIITNCYFINNSASEQGGGLYSEKSSNYITVQNCIFSENFAHDGGGIALYSNLYFTNCIFSNNTALYKGGGLKMQVSYCWPNPTILTNCVFLDNTATMGGGIYDYYSWFEIKECIFSRNSALSGGGMHMYLSYLTITGCTFSENLANDFGGGISCTDSHPLIYHNNFINNAGGNAYDDDGMVFWDNSYPTGGNYWSDFDEPSEGAFDQYHGIGQDEKGPDGIVDLGPPLGGLNPYPGIGFQDRYPLMKPWESPYIPRYAETLD